MNHEYPNSYTAISPGSKVDLSADKDNIKLDASGDFHSVVGLCGVFVADLLLDIAFYEQESFDDAVDTAKRILEKAIDRAVEGNENLKREVQKNGKH